MRRSGRMAMISLIGAVVLSVAAAASAEASDDGAAQALFREAASAWTQARGVEAPNPSTEAHALKLGLLRKVDSTLRRIVERYPATQLGRSLAEGGTVEEVSMARSSLAIEEFLGESCDP